MTAPPPGYAKKAPATAAPPAGYTKKAPAEKPGFFQQPGGLADYLPTGVTNAMQTVDDLTQSAGDVVTRGWGSNDKLTEEARGRTGLMHLPTDIAAGVAASPYMVGGPLTGAAFGAGEGALRSYGNQEGWTPEWGNIANDAKTGALLGAGGYALPGAWNAVKGGLKKAGDIPKITTGVLDYLFAGAPVLTGASTGAKVASKVMPGLPTGEVTRDLLSKIASQRGPR